MSMIKNLESTTKNTEQIMGTRKWNKDSEESPDGENIGLSALIEGWELKVLHHGISSKSQPKDSWNSRRISDIEPLSYYMPWVDGA